ncbi:hypothetical protein PILCRDRAFT_6326 [Piloderma croceum F 1598]|uniref:NACHT domain-containing protein n=1 Tax=Piloderma croceum (strain F 1598) TaxID=765440 RepID=A0A0C3BEI2_PILCF|nr:hypothetical protein PILCRDRAFT_6326 [Piloderma croceum F 1598]
MSRPPSIGPALVQKTPTGDDIRTLCQDLKSHLWPIATKDQRELLEQGAVTTEDVKGAIRKLEDTLKTSKGPTTAEKWAKKLNDVVQKLSPVFDSAAQFGGHISVTVWSSIKTILQAAGARYEALEAIVDTLLFIVDNLPRICTYGRHWPTDLPNPAHHALRDVMKYLIDINKVISSNLKTWYKGFVELPEVKNARSRLAESFHRTDFEAIAQQFKEFKELKAHRDRDRFERLLRRLHLVNYEDDFERRKKARLDGTCTWSGSHLVIEKWLDATTTPEASRLWLYGKPGTGKSTLAAYLLEQAHDRRTGDEVLLYFFCDGKDRNKQTLTSILQTLIAQILRSPDRRLYPEDLAKLQNDILAKSELYSFSVTELESHLLLILKSFTKLRVIIDALDECEAVREDGGYIFESNLLIDVLSRLPQSNMKVLLLSRPEHYIENRLREWPKVEIGGYGTTQQDIRYLVFEKVAELKKAIPHLKDRPHLEELILNAADGMFIYVRLLVETLTASRGFPQSYINGILASSPKGLTEMYERYFLTLIERNKQVPGRNETAFRALQWIAFAEGDMTLPFLNTMLAIDPGNDFQSHNLHADLEIVLKEALGILVDCRHSPGGRMIVTLVHPSFKDFLNRRYTSQVIPELQYLYNSIQREKAHGVLFMTCCTILCLPAVMTPLRQYHESSDKSWLQKLQRKWPWPESPDLQERLGEGREMGTLQKRLGKGHELGNLRRELSNLLALHELLVLQRLRMLRTLRTPRVRMGLAVPGLLEVVDVHRLQETPKPQGLQELEDATRHSLNYFSSYLTKATTNCSAPSVTVVLFTFLEQCSFSAHALASTASTASCMVTPSSHGLFAWNDLVLALRILTIITSNILDHMEPGSDSVHARDHRGFYIPTSIQSCMWHWCTKIPVWFNTGLDNAIVNILPHLISSQNQDILSFVADTLSSLQTVEALLYNVDEDLPLILIGTSNLVHDVQCIGQNLSRWMVLQFVLPAHAELQKVLAEGDFLHPKLYKSPNVLGKVRKTQGLLLLDMNLWIQYPSLLSFIWLFCLLVGSLCSAPLWMMIVVGSVCLKPHQHIFQVHSPSTIPCRITRSIMSFFLLGQLLLMCHHIVAASMLGGMGGICLILHTTKLAQFCLHFSKEGDVLLRLDVVSNQLQRSMMLVSTNIDWVYVHAVSHGLLSVIFVDMSVNTALNLIAVHFVICVILIFIADPNGLQQAIITLMQVQSLFNQLQPRIADAKQSAKLKQLQQYQDMINYNGPF